MNVIEREELVRLSSQVLIAEVLPAPHYAGGHLRGAVHPPLEGLEKRAREVIPHAESPVVGGKAAWKEAGLPFEVR